MGNDIYKIISSPDAIEIYKIETQKNTSKNNINGYPIIKNGGELSGSEVKSLKSILLDEKTYDFELTKRCPFLPEYVFQINKGEKKLNLFVCYSCEKITIIYKTKKIIVDYINVRPKFQHITDKHFK